MDSPVVAERIHSGHPGNQGRKRDGIGEEKKEEEEEEEEGEEEEEEERTGVGWMVDDG